MNIAPSRKEITTEIKILDRPFKVTFVRVTLIVHDANYGADADGHRGTPMTFVEEDYAENIYLGDKALKDYDKDVQEKVQAEVDAWLEANEPQDEDNEPDMDDIGD